MKDQYSSTDFKRVMVGCDKDRTFLAKVWLNNLFPCLRVHVWDSTSDRQWEWEVNDVVREMTISHSDIMMTFKDKYVVQFTACSAFRVQPDLAPFKTSAVCEGKLIKL